MMPLTDAADSRHFQSNGAVDEHIHQILSSKLFRKAPAISGLLEFLCQHRGAAISEYAVAVEALGKRADFDPKIDATVRVHVARLRQKLKEYYETDGRESALRLVIPLGGHELDVVAIPVRQTPPATPRVSRNSAVSAVAGLLLLLAAGLGLANWRLSSRLEALEAERALPRFWQSFFANGKPTMVYLPMPVFFEWHGTTLKARDPLVNDFEEFPNSKELSELTARWGKPRLLQNYTVTSDTFAAFKLVQYLHGRGVNLGVGSSADLSVEAFNTQNVVLIGIPGTSRHIRQLMENLDFHSVPGEAKTILNRRPLGHDPTRFEGTSLSDARRTTYGIIALLPGRTPGTHILMLAGQDSYALVSFLIAPGALDLFERTWRENGSPQRFETVVESEIDGKTVLRARPVAFHSPSATR